MESIVLGGDVCLSLSVKQGDLRLMRPLRDLILCTSFANVGKDGPAMVVFRPGGCGGRAEVVRGKKATGGSQANHELLAQRIAPDPRRPCPYPHTSYAGRLILTPHRSQGCPTIMRQEWK